jgi:Leucine-rich repeat (LRR) protein
MIKHRIFGLVTICISTAGLSDLNLAAAREPDPSRFTIRGDVIQFDSRATDDDVAILGEHLDVTAIYFGGAESGIGPDPRLSPIAVTDAGFTHVAKCKKLQRLVLSFLHPLQVTDDSLKSLAGLSDLRHFTCGVTPFTDAGIAHLASLNNLEELWLDFNSQLGDGCLDTIGRLKKLRVLRFFGASISDAGIAKIKGLKNLEDLQLGKAQIGDASLEIIGAFSKLKTLDLQHTRVTDAGMPHLKHLQLHWLCLSDTVVSSKGFAAISNMTDMQHLFLGYSRIDDNALELISRMKCLESCDLSATRVTGAGVRKLVELENLSLLRLNQLSITDADVAVLVSMKGLKHVELNHTQVAESGFKQLSKAGIDRWNIVP